MRLRDASTLRCNLSKAQALCERIRTHEQEVRGSIYKAEGEISIKSTRSPRPQEAALCLFKNRRRSKLNGITFNG
ncbi:unnamed protein product [Thlaspi arvense]|uniref:Uncharacterized protein n=1 Tax=Thlaspi arvense TaxID=13288 RepID=A0AAU9RNG6_THLAR|nr:unnamed protein product [Thlaspi arvense]